MIPKTLQKTLTCQVALARFVAGLAWEYLVLHPEYVELLPSILAYSTRTATPTVRHFYTLDLTCSYSSMVDENWARA